MIELVHVHKAQDGTTILKDINLTINTGDVVGIIGPSGCGKSTLLRCINLLNPPTSGQIFIDEEEITAPSFNPECLGTKIGMVFQNFNLFEHWTVIENIMNPQIAILKKSRQQAYDTAIDLLKEVGLAQKALAYPHQLSGGQQQRVAICRTLAMDPEVIMFDEPTSALDPTKVGEVEEVIRTLAGQGRTMMIVAHQLNLIRQVANRVLFIDEGGIYEEGTPEQIFDNPQRQKTRVFVKQLKSQIIDITSRQFDFLTAFSEIEAYCARCHLSLKLTRRVQAVFEELCVVSILPHLPETDLHLVFALEWSEQNHQLYATARYTGADFDPEEVDDISWIIIKGNVKSIIHESCHEDDFTNKIDIVFPD